MKQEFEPLTLWWKGVAQNCLFESSSLASCEFFPYAVQLQTLIFILVVQYIICNAIQSLCSFVLLELFENCWSSCVRHALIHLCPFCRVEILFFLVVVQFYCYTHPCLLISTRDIISHNILEKTVSKNHPKQHNQTTYNWRGWFLHKLKYIKDERIMQCFHFLLCVRFVQFLWRAWSKNESGFILRVCCLIHMLCMFVFTCVTFYWWLFVISDNKKIVN